MRLLIFIGFSHLEIEGLEFSDVVLVNFFKNIPTPSLKKAWKQLLQDALSSVLEAPRNTASSLSLPQALELELKLLYTGVTRTCNRLLFIETSKSDIFNIWCRLLSKKKLAERMKVEAVIGEGQKLMTTDEWRVEGIEMAMQQPDEVEDQLKYLERAIDCFKKAGDNELAERASVHRKAVLLEESALAQEDFFEDTKSQFTVSEATDAILSYLEAGMTKDAARLAGDVCASVGLVGLESRIKKLGDKT